MRHAKNEASPCRTCGRPVERVGRASSGRAHCSARCRAQRVGALDRALESALLDLTAARAASSSACPSEAARAVDPERWRALSERARNAVRRLAARGELEVLQDGRPVDAARMRGPVRVRRPAAPASGPARPSNPRP